MAGPGLSLDIGVLYLACGIPITVLGVLVGAPFAIGTGVGLVVAGLFFLLIAAVLALRHRGPQAAPEPWQSRPLPGEGGEK
jgi:hypothetical protein